MKPNGNGRFPHDLDPPDDSSDEDKSWFSPESFSALDDWQDREPIGSREVDDLENADESAPSGNERAVLQPIAEMLRRAGLYAYVTLDDQNRWSACADTDEGRIDIRLGTDGLEVEVWGTSPGLYVEVEPFKRRIAMERLARISLPAIARGYLLPGQEIWWDETDHGLGARIRSQLPFAVQEQIGAIALRRLGELNELIVLVEQKLNE